MATRKPLVLVDGQQYELVAGDVISAAQVGLVTANKLVVGDAAGVLASAPSLTHAASGTHLLVTAQAASDVPLAVKAAASQTGRLTEWQAPAGVALAGVSARGFVASLAGPTAGEGDTLRVYAQDATYGRRVGLFFQDNGAEGGVLGDSQLYLKASGTIYLNPTGMAYGVQFAKDAGSEGVVFSNAVGSLINRAATGTYVPDVVRGAPAQSANLTEWQDSAGAVLARIEADGDIVGANLSGINTGDQGTFAAVAVAGQTTVQADGTADTLTLVAGSNITLTTDAATDTVTISVTGGGGGGAAYKGVVRVLKALPPATLYATFDTRAGGSTPAEAFEVADFDAATTEYMDYLCQLDGYAGGGLTVSLAWAATSATSGTVKWDVGVRRLGAAGDDLDASKTYDYNTASGTADAASGKLTYTTLTFTHGADMDSWADGELALVRVRRDVTVTGNMTGDAELLSVRGRES